MSNLTYHTSSPSGARNRQVLHFSQAVRIGSRVELAGHGGGDPATGIIPPTLSLEIDQAFANVDTTLRAAGCSGGWAQVYKVVTYHVGGMGGGAVEDVVRNLKMWCKGHQPLWTGVGVVGLARPGMRVEIEVVAWDGEGDGERVDEG